MLTGCVGGRSHGFSKDDTILTSNMNGDDRAPKLQATRRYPVLDAWRFILAFWVVTSHVGMIPIFASFNTDVGAMRMISHGFETIVYGIPAVIGFFVISGFCIHLPFRNAARIPVGKFYARRYIRIMVPVLVSFAIYRVLGNRRSLFGPTSVFWNSVLWSLLCEEIYYAVYPAMWWCRKKFGWTAIIGIAFAAGAITALAHFHWESWIDFGPIQTAVILYPVWLLGCLLAEQTERLGAPGPAWNIWGWRVAVWLGSWICEMLNFHGGVPYTQTMLWFGILTYFWLKKELAYGMDKKPVAILAWGGAWSYSLYLMHVPAMAMYERLPLHSFGPLAGWCSVIGFILAVAYVFYLLVEKPSHLLARKIGTSRDREAKPIGSAQLQT